MVRYQAQVAVFRATVPLGVPIPDYAFEPKTLVDQYTSSKWKELGLVPSELCSDEQFIRRRLARPDRHAADAGPGDGVRRRPGPEQARQAGRRAGRFAGIQLLFRQQVGRHPPRQAARPGRPGPAAPSRSTTGFARRWPTDKPYDQFAREILGASGDEATSPPTVWYKELQEPQQFVDDTAQVFLGLRLACAQCHHHPYEKWSQDDYWGIAAFFGRIGRRKIPVPGEFVQQPVVRDADLQPCRAAASSTSEPARRP